MKKFLYFLGGAALGLAIGILLAPNEGKQTREKIKRELKDVIEAILKRKLEEENKDKKDE
jgi:gas vesicle protein